MTSRELFNENIKFEEIKKFYRIKYNESKTPLNNKLIYLQIEDNHNLFSLDN